MIMLIELYVLTTIFISFWKENQMYYDRGKKIALIITDESTLQKC